MSKAFKVFGHSNFTDWGRIGAWMFVVCPIVSSGLYFWMVNELIKPYGGNPYLPATLLLFSSTIFLISIPVMLVGRSMSFTIEVSEDKNLGGGR